MVPWAISCFPTLLHASEIFIVSFVQAQNMSGVDAYKASEISRVVIPAFPS